MFGSSIEQTKTFNNKYVVTCHVGAAAVVQAKEVNMGHQIDSPDLVLSFPKPVKICNKQCQNVHKVLIRNNESNKLNTHLFNNLCIYSLFPKSILVSIRANNREKKQNWHANVMK